MHTRLFTVIVAAVAATLFLPSVGAHAHDD